MSTCPAPSRILREPRFWWAALAGWLGVVFLSSATWFVDLQRSGRPAEWWMIVREIAILWLPWIAIIPTVFRLVEYRSQLDARARHRVVLPLLWATLGFLLYIPVRGLVTAWAQQRSLFDSWSVLRRISFFEWFIDTFFLLGLVAIATAVTTARISRRREQETHALALRNAHLEADLGQVKLQMLRAQLEPHFLHNALNTVTALIRCDEPHRAIDALTRLSTLLRFATAATTRDTVTVAEEVDLVESYLEFQQLRFGDRLSFQIEISDDISDREIPPLILQPLLENAIHHGIEQCEAASEIVWTGAAEGPGLRFEVSNSPCPARPRTDGHGIGLENTRQRLDLRYGDRYELTTQRVGDRFVTRLELDSSTAPR